MNKRMEAVVTGYVQGVSYRYYTRKMAQKLGLTGWVANSPDGSVRVVVEGPTHKLSDFNRYLLQGSPHAHVEHVRADWLDATGEFSGFTIRYL